MTVQVTFYAGRPRDASQYVDVLGAQIGSRADVAGGGTYTPPASGFIRVYATAAHTVRIGLAADAAATGEPWPEGRLEVRFIKAGQVLKVA